VTAVWFINRDAIDAHPCDNDFALTVELGWRANTSDHTDPDRLAWTLERQISERKMEALDAQA
jgi:hypothetical protein